MDWALGFLKGFLNGLWKNFVKIIVMDLLWINVMTITLKQSIV